MAVDVRGSLLAGRYRVLERLGSGGMATVYLAEDERLGRRVAVKRLSAERPEEDAARFEREARLGASLNHPNVVAVYDAIASDDGVLIVMEYVEGRTLAAALAEGPLGPAAALEVLRPVAAALDQAHAQGVVHRDVKPANVLLGPGGTVKLADLGIATVTEGTQITRTDTVLGTPSYMAPEQLEGGRRGPAVDVYALAAVAYEALSGERARSGDTPLEIAHRVATEPAPNLSDAWPHAPPAVAALLRRAMGREPSERPRSAGALVEELATGLGQGTAAGVVAADGAEAGSVAATEQLERGATQPLDPGARPQAAAAPQGSASRASAAAGDLPRAGARSRARPSWLAPAALLLVLALVGVGVLALLGGAPGSGSGADRAAEPAEPPASSRGEDSSDGEGESEPDSSPAEQEIDPDRGRRLNDQGFALINSGRNEQAVPILERAVAAFPDGSEDMNYAFALYNLAHALRLSGRPAEAIPYLERRLEVSDFKRGVVRRELELARSGSSAAGGKMKSGGKAKKDGKAKSDAEE